MSHVAMKMLQKIADEPTNRLAKKAVDTGVAHWRHDNHQDGVYGLVKATTEEALVVVYLEEEDFEVSDAVEMCEEFDEFGTCIHSDHMIQEGM